MGNKNTIDVVRILEKEQKKIKIFNIIRDVDKTTTLKDLRDLDDAKISLDYEFLDGEYSISEELEQKFLVKDLIKDDNYFFSIYIQKKNKENSLIEIKKEESSYENDNLITSNISKYLSSNPKNNDKIDYKKISFIDFENKKKIIINPKL